MGFLASLTNQLGIMLKSQSTARRIMLLVVALASLGGMGWLIINAQSGGGYVTLISNLRPADGVEAMAKLQQLGIKAKMENGGTSIRVPQNRFDDAIMMLSMEGIPGNSGTVGYEMMDKTSFGQTKFQQEKNYLRMREGELSRTLLTIREIERAKIHLALPEDTLFVQDQKEATASVVLKLHTGARLAEKQVSGIVNLVSHSIEGLKPENVSVIDDMGTQLNLQKDDNVSQSTAAQQGYKLQYEDLLKNRIESMLENTVGRGKVSARVQADFNFASQHQIKQVYNPDDQNAILKMEKSTSENTTGKGANGIQGVPGSTSNLLVVGGGAANSATSATQGGISRTDKTSEYAVSSTWEETQQQVPTPKQISVAVLVDWVEDKDAQGKSTWRDRTPEELTALEDLVKAAIGYQNVDGQRVDQVKVVCQRFHNDATDTTKENFFNSYTGRQMIQLGVQWGIVLLIGLLLILMVLRPAVRQITVTAVEGGMQALPAGAAGAIGALEAGGGTEGVEGGGELGQLPASMVAQLPPDMQAALRATQGKGGKGSGDVLDDIDLSEIPEELRDNQDAIRQFKLQRLAAKQARLTQAEAQRIHQEVVDTAKNNPQKTVSLIRQWMDEA